MFVQIHAALQLNITPTLITMNIQPVVMFVQLMKLLISQENSVNQAQTVLLHQISLFTVIKVKALLPNAKLLDILVQITSIQLQTLAVHYYVLIIVLI